IIQALLTALLLGGARTGYLRQPINCRHGTGIDGALERNAKSVTDRDAPLLHRNRGQGWANHVARGVYAGHSRAEILVDGNPATSVQLYPQGLEPESLSVCDSAGGK